jgi:hypothetical protein
VGCFATGFTSSLVDLGPSSPLGASDVLRTARQGLEVAKPRILQLLRVALASSKAADAVPILGQFLIAAQGVLAISDGITAVQDCNTH